MSKIGSEQSLPTLISFKVKEIYEAEFDRKSYQKKKMNEDTV